MSIYTQRDWSQLNYDVADLAVDTVSICFPRQARKDHKPIWYVRTVGGGIGTHVINGWNGTVPIKGRSAYDIKPPDWVYEEMQRAIAEHTTRYEELLNLLFFNTPEKRAEELANQLAGKKVSLRVKIVDARDELLKIWKDRIRLYTQDVDYSGSGISQWKNVKGLRVNFEHNDNRSEIWVNGSFLQLFKIMEELDIEVNKWIKKILA